MCSTGFEVDACNNGDNISFGIRYALNDRRLLKPIFFLSFPIFFHIFRPIPSVSLSLLFSYYSFFCFVFHLIICHAYLIRKIFVSFLEALWPEIPFGFIYLNFRYVRATKRWQTGGNDDEDENDEANVAYAQRE